MICWYCYWGWAKPVADIYSEAKRRLDGYADPLHYGPAHVVWDDENFDSAQSCLDNFDKYTGDYTAEQLAVVRWSLEQLAALPPEQWNIEPEDYDGENPQLFPPTVPVEKV